MSQINTDAIDKGFAKTFNSFSGTDIVAVIGNTVIGEIQGVSFTTTREKAPLYVMGRANPISYSRGKRGIAGSLIFLTLDQAAIIGSIDPLRKQFFARRVELNFAEQVLKLGVGDVRNIERTMSDGRKLPPFVAHATAWYPDQIPPFNIVLIAENEYGGGSTMSIIGCEILNNGSGVSVDDITTDEQMTFVALDIRSWKPLSFFDPITGNNLGEGGAVAGRRLTEALVGA